MNPSNAHGHTKEELDQLLFLRHFVKLGDETRVKKLLEQKPRLNCINGGEILWDAVLSDHLNIATMLIEAGATGTALMAVKPNDKLRSTFLHEFVKRNSSRHHKLAVLLINRGAGQHFADQKSLMAIEYAIRMESPIDRITDFLQHGAHVFGRCIADAARHPRAAELIPLLVNAGSAEARSRRIVDALDRCSARWITESSIMPAVKIMLDMKPIPAAEIEKRGFSMRAAIQANKVNLVRLLVKYGFDVNKQEPRGPSLLYAAARLKRSTLMEMLIRAGAKVFQQGYPMHAAIKNLSVENIKILLRLGVDVNAPNRYGQTPFILTRCIPYVNATSELPIRRLARNPCSSIDDLRYGAAHRMIIKYLAIRSSRGKEIDDFDLGCIKNHRGMSVYYKECLMELEMMKLMKIINNVTFFSIFETSVNLLTFFARNDNFLKSYDEAQRESDFPIYHEEMDFALDNARTRKNILSEREEAICEALENILPYIPLEKIIYYFYLNNIE